MEQEQNILEEYKDNVFYEPEIAGIEKKGDNLIITHGQETAPILEMNHELRKYSDDIWSKGKMAKWVARVPTVVWFMWERMGITQDDKALYKMLNLYSQYKTTTKTL